MTETIVMGVFIGFLIIVILFGLSFDGPLLTNDLKTLSYLVKNKHKLKLNLYNADFISIEGGTYILKRDNNPLYRWVINDLGVIPRWHKSHKYLNKIYKELLTGQRDKYQIAFGEE